MSLSGQLGELDLFEVIQMIFQFRKSGQLEVRAGDIEGRIAFHDGLIVGATVPGASYLGEVLLLQGAVRPNHLGEALRVQGQNPGKSLGQILLSSCVITAEDLAKAVHAQIRECVERLLHERTGSFEFIVGDVTPLDDIALAPLVSLNPEHVLLEAARKMDEAKAESAAGSGDRAVATRRQVRSIQGVERAPSRTAYLYLRPNSTGGVETPFRREAGASTKDKKRG